MTDQQLLERRVRETLATRAEGVDATPALYERIRDGQQRAHRRGQLRAWTALAAVLAVAAAVVVGLPDDPTVDIVDRPPAVGPVDGEGAPSTDGDGVDTALPSDLPFGGVGYAHQDDDGLVVFAPGGEPLLDVPRTEVAVADLAVPSGWTAGDGVLAAFSGAAEEPGSRLWLYGMEDGDVGWIGSISDVAPSGGRIAMTPDGSSVLWIRDGELVVVEIGDGSDFEPNRSFHPLPLPADGPSRLVAQQVLEHRDGSLTLLATDPGELDVWAVRLDLDQEGDLEPVAVTEPLPGLGPVVDVVALPDGRLLTLELSSGGSQALVLRLEDGGVHALPDVAWPNARLELDSGGGWQVTVHDGARGQVRRYLVAEEPGQGPPVVELGGDVAAAGVHVGADASAWRGDADSTGG